jgi:hypothetical protein
MVVTKPLRVLLMLMQWTVERRMKEAVSGLDG